MFDRLKSIYEKMLKSIQTKNKIYQLDTLNYEKVIQLIKEKGILEEFEHELSNLDEIEKLMRNKTNLHGINHIVRVLFNAYALSSLENIKDKDRMIIVEAAKLHDIGRTTDGEDEGHGAKSAIKAREILAKKGFSSQQINEICFLIKEHSIPRSKNNMHIEGLPEEIRERYRYHLNLLKDADKLDRVRIGDLNPQRLSTDSAKRLVEVAKDVFENKRYYYRYNKKMKIYPFDKKEAEGILKEIKKVNPDFKINLDEIKKNYILYKSMQEQNKIEWLKNINKDILPDDWIEIVNVLAKEDMEYFRNRFLVDKKIIIQAIHSMGIDKYMELKRDRKLSQLMNLNNHAKSFAKMTKEEVQLVYKFRKYDERGEVINSFYLFYHAIKNFEPEKTKMLLLSKKDTKEYISNRTNRKDSGYKWRNNLLVAPIEFEIFAINNLDTKLMMEIRETFKIPYNIIITAMLELNGKEIKKDDLEKVIVNYYKFNLNIRKEKNIEQVKKLLLSLPENLGHEYENIIQECLVGRLKRFNLDNFEQIKNYEEICDKKILQELEQSDDIHKLKNLIFETKFKNLEGIKRDLYFYKKYQGKETQNSEVFNLFQTLLETENKDELVQVYKKLNHISTEFDLDGAFQDIQDELIDISKQDVVVQMNNMDKKIKNAKTKMKDEEEVIDLTGTEFNLLISVIGGSGSPYLVEYHNKLIDRGRKFLEFKIPVQVLNEVTDKHIKMGIKRLVNKRYRLDPLKNKQRCVSSIDQDFMGHIPSEQYTEGKGKQREEKLILAYFPKYKKDISCMGNQDLMTSYDKERNHPSRKRIPHKDNIQGICNLKLQDLNAITLGENNELIVDSYPGAVMCFDKVSNIAKKTAKKLNIPILYIDSKEQFKKMAANLNNYYENIQSEILKENQITNETFEKAFNIFEQNNNIIHRAFKMANGFAFLDKDEYPQEQIMKIFCQMEKIVGESLKRCNSNQKEVIRNIMLQEANSGNVRYGYYNSFINFEKLIDLVSKENENNRTKVVYKE